MPLQNTQKTMHMPEVSRMEALGRLSCKVAHDFNNILGGIEGYATLAMNNTKENEVLARDLREIRTSVAKAALLSRCLVAFSGRQMLQKTQCEIAELVNEALKKAQLGEVGNISVDVRAEPGLPGILADSAQMGQALVNLLVNAREAMTAGGTLTVRSSLARLAPEKNHAPAPEKSAAVFVKISIEDTGDGIAAEVMEHIFEPLFSGRKKSQSAGLGLSTVYGTVKQHNGWVEVVSEPGRGSEFILFLPAVAAHS